MKIGYIREESATWIDEVSTQMDRSHNELIGMFLNYALDHCVVKDDTEEKKIPRSICLSCSWGSNFIRLFCFLIK